MQDVHDRKTREMIQLFFCFWLVFTSPSNERGTSQTTWQNGATRETRNPVMELVESV